MPIKAYWLLRYLQLYCETVKFGGFYQKSANFRISKPIRPGNEGKATLLALVNLYFLGEFQPIQMPHS